MDDSFLKLLAQHLSDNYKDKLEHLCIVLPNKRGALYLKKYLAQQDEKAGWLPTIISAEELIAELSGLKVLDEIDLVCHLYESYKYCYGKDAEPFDSFVKWGQLILQDFNEIDRYLADTKQLYENLREIKVIENWSLGAETLTNHQTNYLKFMSSLGAIYKNFSSFLLSNGWAYQGLAYKQAVLNLDKQLFSNQFSKLIFCGFNALNAAEIKIFNHFHKQQLAEIIWDADEYYLKDVNQEAGMFLRENMKVFGERVMNFIGTYFKEPKEIQVIATPGQIGQAQVVKQTLQHLLTAGVSMDKVAVVLANEKLLWPVLQQLPEEIEFVNITMEYPLRYTSTYSFVESLIQIQVGFSKQKHAYKTLYHKDFVGLMRHPVFGAYLKAKQISIDTDELIKQITERNIAFISNKHINELFAEHFEAIKDILSSTSSVSGFCNILLHVIQNIIAYFSELELTTKLSLELEYLQILLKNFNRLNEVLQTYPHFNDINSFKQLFQQIVGASTAPFIGEPLRGLQIMGVLETRTLDFDHIIFVNVNEGVLPSGKTIHSFIPNDLKRAFGLPLYLEKDAIYAYHFYRLLQRAKDVVITYDSETDSFGKGEKSRFVTQLQVELQAYNTNIQINESVAVYTQQEPTRNNIITITKTDEVLKPLLAKACSNEEFSGLSPSSLIAFKECGLKFYFRYSAGIKELTEVEEVAEANTFGSILHLSLETLYKPFVGKILKSESIQSLYPLIHQTVNESFISFFDGRPPEGKSILQEEVIKVYVKKLLNSDSVNLKTIEANKLHLTLNALEKEFSSDIEITDKKVKVFIKGKIDRIDSCTGIVRIIDYKSSIKPSDKFVFTNFEDLFYDKQYNKQFQLIIYAWLLYKINFCAPELMQPCIIQFKVFSEKPQYLYQDKEILQFNKQFFESFELALKQFLSGIFETETAFFQTEDTDLCQYCGYNTICNSVD